MLFVYRGMVVVMIYS